MVKSAFQKLFDNEAGQQTIHHHICGGFLKFYRNDSKIYESCTNCPYREELEIQN